MSQDTGKDPFDGITGYKAPPLAVDATLLDLFAAHALTGLLAGNADSTLIHERWLASTAYMLATAMLKQRSLEDHHAPLGVGNSGV